MVLIGGQPLSGVGSMIEGR